MPEPGDIVPAPRERAQHDPIEPVDEPIEDARGGTGRPWRVIDTIGRLLRNGSIDEAAHAAALRFRGDFRAAQQDTQRAMDLCRVPGGPTSGTVLTERSMRARESVWLAIDACGGVGALPASALWHVAGEELTIKQWAERQRHGSSTRPLREETASGVLIGALDVLAAHYDRLDRTVKRDVGKDDSRRDAGRCPGRV